MAEQEGRSGVFEDAGAEDWEERYRSRDAVWSGRPNVQLVAEVAELAPGTALDVGCGEGADAIWLAERGWRVTAVDFAPTALRRGAAHAESLGAELAARIQWVPEDLTVWTPPENHFDLVTAHYMQLMPEPRKALFRRLAAAVSPGGTLLIVGHHPSDMEVVHRVPPAERFYPAEEVAAELDPERWEIVVADARPRPATDHDGREVTIHDAVLRARKRA